MARLTLAVPDLISNSYFPAVAAVELGYFSREGYDIALELIFPVDKCYAALRDGQIALVGGSAHSALSSFPEWKGVKLLAAQAQGMYWFLVVRKDLFAGRGNLDVIKGKRIGAAPWVEMGLRQLLVAAGYDLQRDNISIAPVPGTAGTGTNFGLTAAKALEAGLIDGFWANGMGCEVAVRSGAGAIVLDIRRGDGPAGCFDYTLASIAATDTMIEQNPSFSAAAVRALGAAKATLRQTPEIAGDIARKIFPPAQAELIVDIIRRDLPYYSSQISPDTVAGMNAFARKIGILNSDVPYEAIVATQFTSLWTT